MAIWKKDTDIKQSSYTPPDPKFYKEMSKERGAVPSIISENSEFKGNIRTDGEVQIDGQLRGNVTAKQIVVGEAGKVRGDITSNFLKVCGRVEGDVKAETIEMAASSSVKGNVYKKTISIEHGAKIIGNINELESGTARIFKLQRKTDNKEE